MPDMLIPVGTHFFTKDALDQAISKALPAGDVGSSGGASVGVDSEGVKVAVLWTSHDDHVRIRGAFTHGFDGDNSVAGDVLFRF